MKKLQVAELTCPTGRLYQPTPGNFYNSDYVRLQQDRNLSLPVCSQLPGSTPHLYMCDVNAIKVYCYIDSSSHYQGEFYCFSRNFCCSLTSVWYNKGTSSSYVILTHTFHSTHRYHISSSSLRVFLSP